MIKRAARYMGFFIPHFVTEEMACEEHYCPDDWALPPSQRRTHLEIICPLEDVEEGEVFDCVITVKAFAFLFWGFLPKPIGGRRPFVNPHGSARNAGL